MRLMGQPLLVSLMIPHLFLQLFGGLNWVTPSLQNIAVLGDIKFNFGDNLESTKALRFSCVGGDALSSMAGKYSFTILVKNPLKPFAISTNLFITIHQLWRGRGLIDFGCSSLKYFHICMLSTLLFSIALI